jgi:hypothetical protein
MTQKEEKRLIQFMADSVKVYPPTMDGSIKVTFSTGEYEKHKLIDLFTLDQGKTLKITVETQ